MLRELSPALPKSLMYNHMAFPFRVLHQGEVNADFPIQAMHVQIGRSSFCDSPELS